MVSGKNKCSETQSLGYETQQKLIKKCIYVPHAGNARRRPPHNISYIRIVPEFKNVHHWTPAKMKSSPKFIHRTTSGWLAGLLVRWLVTKLSSRSGCCCCCSSTLPSSSSSSEDECEDEGILPRQGKSSTPKICSGVGQPLPRNSTRIP